MSRATEIRVATLRVELDALRAEAVVRDDIIRRLISEVSQIRRDLDRELAAKAKAT